MYHSLLILSFNTTKCVLPTGSLNKPQAKLYTLSVPTCWLQVSLVSCHLRLSQIRLLPFKIADQKPVCLLPSSSPAKVLCDSCLQVFRPKPCVLLPFKFTGQTPVCFFLSTLPAKTLCASLLLYVLHSPSSHPWSVIMRGIPKFQTSGPQINNTSNH